MVVTRDRFSTTQSCLETLLQNTPDTHEVLVVMGGVPANLQKKWTTHFGSRVRWHFEPNLLNPSELRNIGLKEARTPLAVLMDNDVFVRPGWLEPLLQCLNETGAAMVVPVILDEDDEIHTAGNDLHITYREGKAYGCKELRYGTMRYFEGSNLKREKTDYGELHCQLMVVKTALDLGVFDEKLREVAEVDSGLVWAKAGCGMVFEPKSVVIFRYAKKIHHAEDIAPFLYKWNTPAIVEGYHHFERKWNMDITEGGKWPEFLVFLNSKLGLFPRMFPNAFGMFLDGVYRNLRHALGAPMRWMRTFNERRLGRSAWMLILCANMMLVAPAQALEGLKSLQKAALSDQATECMVHEYTRRYNEVLREASRKRKSWQADLDETAHTEAMKWVKDVWRDADPNVVDGNLKSEEFLKAVKNFRSYQKNQYPNLNVVN